MFETFTIYKVDANNFMDLTISCKALYQAQSESCNVVCTHHSYSVYLFFKFINNYYFIRAVCIEKNKLRSFSDEDPDEEFEPEPPSRGDFGLSKAVQFNWTLDLHLSWHVRLQLAHFMAPVS